MFHSARTQDSVLYRLIFIGDAGEMDKAQQALIPDASGMVLKQDYSDLSGRQYLSEWNGFT